MTATCATVAYLGLEPRSVEVQVQLIAGLPAFNVVGLADKAVAESRERVRGAIAALGLALPPKRIVVNLSPADLPKEGAHFDLPSRWRCWRRWGWSMPRRLPGTSWSASWRWTRGCSRRPACCWRRCTRRRRTRG